MNLDSIIKAHNVKILNKEEDNSGNDDKTCNCRDQTACPVGNNCLKNNVVYKAHCPIRGQGTELHWHDGEHFQDQIHATQGPPSNTAQNVNRQNCLTSYGHLRTMVQIQTNMEYNQSCSTIPAWQAHL